MSGVKPYYGPFELLTMEEAASRCKIGIDLFRKRYGGPLLRVGSSVRVSAADLHEWASELGSAGVKSDPWEGVGDNDAEEGALPKRKQGQVA